MSCLAVCCKELETIWSKLVDLVNLMRAKKVFSLKFLCFKVCISTEINHYSFSVFIVATIVNARICFKRPTTNQPYCTHVKLSTCTSYIHMAPYIIL